MAARQLYTAIPLLDETDIIPKASKLRDLSAENEAKFERERRQFMTISRLSYFYGCHRHTTKSRIEKLLSTHPKIFYHSRCLLSPKLLQFFVEQYGMP